MTRMTAIKAINATRVETVQDDRDGSTCPILAPGCIELIGVIEEWWRMQKNLIMRKI